MIQVSGEISREIGILGVSAMAGAVLFFCYDILRIFRRVIPHGVRWISVEDIFYWLGCTAAVFLLLYRIDDGMVRGFSLGGIGIGAGIYYALLSRHIVRVFTVLFRKINTYLGKALRVLFGPVFRIFRKIWRGVKKQLKKIAKAVKMGLCKQ